MRKTIQIDEETALLIDAERGDLSRDDYIDKLLKSYQGVTQCQPPEPVIENGLDK
jgi:hypothetical protein